MCVIYDLPFCTDLYGFLQRYAAQTSLLPQDSVFLMSPATRLAKAEESRSMVTDLMDYAVLTGLKPGSYSI